VFKVPAIEREEDEFEVGMCEENLELVFSRTGVENDLGSNGGVSRGSIGVMTGGFNSRSMSRGHEDDEITIGIPAPALPSNETPRKLEEDEI
jgi:hypothetical protein